jgi:hypothetical protein
MINNDNDNVFKYRSLLYLKDNVNVNGPYIWGTSIRVGGGLYSGGGGYIWNEVSVSICGGLIFGGL